MTGGIPWRCIAGPQSLLFGFLVMRRADLVYHVLLPWFATSSQSPKQWANHSWNKTSKTVSQNKLSLFMIHLSQVFCSSNGKWLTKHLCEKEGLKNMMHIHCMLKEGIVMSWRVCWLYIFFQINWRIPLNSI
jgi:hypothetical protein